MTDDNKAEEFAKEYMERVEAGVPIMNFLIEPPFKINVEGNVIHLDAPCLAAGGTDRAAVLRVSLTAGAAKALKDFLQTLEFSEPSGGSKSSH